MMDKKIPDRIWISLPVEEDEMHSRPGIWSEKPIEGFVDIGPFVLESKRFRQDWMTLDQDSIDDLSVDDWEHYKNGGCLCFAYGPDECCCGSWQKG